MNETIKLLEVLAIKLGTTTDYLWNILLKQAPINFVVDCIQYLLIIIGCLFWYKATMKLHKNFQEEGWDEVNYLWVGIIWGILIVLVLTMFFCLPDTIYSLVNPEYWALKKILTAIKPS